MFMKNQQKKQNLLNLNLFSFALDLQEIQEIKIAKVPVL